ncbi:hypothetical protein [Nocardia sp. NPDC051570]|uniref:hypothetical protein n=1 Tax=Nocardia sp. NPDC051570 TaxID=3364324 RepID=UPI00378C4FC8
MYEQGQVVGHRDAGRVDPALAALSAQDRLVELRRRIAAVPGRVGAGAPATVAAHDVLPVPGALGELLPHGGVVRGTVVSCPRGVVLSAILAGVTGSGRHAAIVGNFRQFRAMRPALLDIWEMGGTLEKVALVDATAGAPAEIVHVLADGIEAMVLFDMPRLHLTPTQHERLRARLRTTRSILVVTGGTGARQPHLTIDYRRVGDTGIGRGRGRFARLELDVRVTAAGESPHRGRVMLTGVDGERTQWIPGQSERDRGPRRLAQTG